MKQTALNQTDVLAESGLLGSMLIAPEESDPIVERLQPEHFSKKAHQQLFQVLAELRKKGVNPELPVVEEKLNNAHGWRSDGSTTVFLCELMQTVPATTLADHYVQKIREQHQARQIQYAARDLAVAAAKRDMGKACAVIDKLAQISTATLTSPVVSLSDAADEYAQTLRSIDRGDLRRYKCGLPVFDDVINAGMHPGILPAQVGVICGRTGYGKSTLAAFVAFQMVRFDPACRVHFFSLEMPAQMIGAKAIKAQIAVDAITAGKKHERAELAAINVRGTWGDRVSISGEHEPDEVLARASQLARDGVNVFVFDHLHRVGRAGKEPRFAYGDFMQDLTAHAKRHNVAWIVAAQISRKYSTDFANNKHRLPMDSDLAESGLVEQHMHWCVALHFDDPKNRNLARLCVLKNRHGQTNQTELVSVDYEKQSYSRRY